MAKFIVMDSYDNYWSNDDGWVSDPRGASVFNFQEVDVMDLPIGGFWVRLT
jgi:hypothetical protein